MTVLKRFNDLTEEVALQSHVPRRLPEARKSFLLISSEQTQQRQTVAWQMCRVVMSSVLSVKASFVATELTEQETDTEKHPEIVGRGFFCSSGCFSALKQKCAGMVTDEAS